jgi:hypothetical protein
MSTKNWSVDNLKFHFNVWSGEVEHRTSLKPLKGLDKIMLIYHANQLFFWDLVIMDQFLANINSLAGNDLKMQFNVHQTTAKRKEESIQISQQD